MTNGKYSVNRNRLKKFKEKVESRSSGKFRYLKKDSTAVLRILPFPAPDGEGCDLATMLVEHRTADSQAKNVGICMREMFDKPCAMCRANDIERENGGKPLFVTRTRYLVNAYNTSDPKPQMSLWALPKTVNDVLIDYLLDPEYEDILDPKLGHAFSITSSGSGLDTEYSTKPSRKPVPVPADLLKGVVDPITEVKEVSVETQCEAAGLDKEDLWDDSELEQIASGKPTKKTGQAAKPAASPKKSTKKPEPEETDGLEPGDKVWYDEDGEDVLYEIVSVSGDSTILSDEDGNEYEVPSDSVHPVGAETEAEVETANESPEESGDIEVGSFVICPADGDNVVYEVMAVEDDTATIENADGVQYEVGIGDLEITSIPF